MTELLHKIQTLIDSSNRDLDQLERTLTDGYAHALFIEAEKSRLEKQISSVAHTIQRGDTAKKARELAQLAKRLEGHEGDLSALRGLLGRLRRHADGVRVGSPVR
jgi:DNA-directed RNA polymerase beta' subunit